MSVSAWEAGVAWPPPDQPDRPSLRRQPDSDWGTPPGYQRHPNAPGLPAVPPAPPSPVPCEGAEILARVGNDVILAREVSMGIPDLRQRNAGRVPAEVLETQIRELLRKRVNERVEQKLICQHAQRTIPAERFSKIMEHYSKVYDQYQVPEMIKQLGLHSRQELQQALQQAGISLEVHKRAFIEKVLADEWLRTEAKPDEDITHEQMLAYYREHLSEYEQPAAARWEQLMVRTARFPTREAAYAALAEMGNRVLEGVPLAEVARAASHGATAAQGGLWDWTTQGSLVSKVLDQAIFSLPLGQLSEILEDEQGFHIVRVLQRRGAVRKPFEEVQPEIKRKIRAAREAQAKAAFLDRLRQETPVWTAFDQDQLARPPLLEGLFW
ncbi:MAG: peptidylprolyl isomerase [Thermoguttaceae bacterium]